MAKFEVEMQIQGFKLRVWSEREEDVPRITGQLGQQLAGLLRPSTEILDVTPRVQTAFAVNAPEEKSQDPNKRKRHAKSSRIRKSGASESAGSQMVNWQHAPAKWGMPRQAWTTGQKILWTLYVAAKETSHEDLSSPAIAETFNTAFREFGPLAKQNLPRELGNLKKKTPTQVLDNRTGSPIKWYLTDAGSREAEKLVAEAKDLNSVT
jgi:hypothetical protein